MLTLISGLQGPLGQFPFAFSLSGSLLFFVCALKSQISPSLTRVVPSVCHHKHFPECLLTFSPQEPLSFHLLPLWWLLSLTLWVLWYQDSPFVVLIPWLKTGSCAGLSSIWLFPGGSCCRGLWWLAQFENQIHIPSASPVAVLLLQVFCKGAVSKNTSRHTSEMTQDLYKTWVHYQGEVS